MPPGEPLTEAWLKELLEIPKAQQRLSAIQAAGLLHPDGLTQLLDSAMRMARSDPGQAKRLTLICGEAAQKAALPQIIPRATYVRAQTHAINGEFTTALDLIQTARTEYEAIDATMEALRTNLGKMHVLNELGRHQEALDAGQEILERIEAQGVSDPQTGLIQALAHMNQGVCYETMGRYKRALEAYDRAEHRFIELDFPERLGDVSNNRGIVLVHLGRVREALGAFERALAIWSERGLILLQAQTLSNIADAHLAMGSYTRGLNAFERARDLYTELDARANYSILLRKTADAYLALNLYPEALSTYREAEEMLGELGMADHHARALWGMGAALIAQSRPQEAAPVLEKAARLFEKAENQPMLCSVRLEQSALDAAQGQRDAALQMAERALALADRETYPVEYLYANMRLAELSTGDTAAAERYLSEVRDLAERLHLPTIRYRLNSRLGRLRASQGRAQEAQKLLEAAVDQIETWRGDLPYEAIRTSFMQDKTNVYEDLIRLHLDSGDRQGVRKAFEVAESAKSRALVDLLAGVITPQPQDTGDPALASRLENIQADLNAAYHQFFDRASGVGSGNIPELQDRIKKLENEIKRLRLQSAGRTAASDPFAEAFSLQELVETLPDKPTLLEYHLVGDEILAFILKGEDLQVVRQVSRGTAVQHLLGRLTAQLDRFRAGGAFVQRNMDVLEESSRRVLESLYRELFQPLERHLGPVGSARDEAHPMDLAVIPHGLLHQVPFHALHDGERYLIDTFEISYALSATVFALCQRRGQRIHRRGLVVGVADALIPAVDAEAHAVAQQLERGGLETVLLTGGTAEREELQAQAPGCDVLHLACHGLFRSDNPIFSALKLSDQWLTAADAMHLRLDGSLVALSACESGRNQVLMGDEVIGFPRAFLGGGASSVLVSLWLVQDETTVSLMNDWYAGINEGLGRAAALRRAQRALKLQHPHPYYWAPFLLIGAR